MSADEFRMTFAEWVWPMINQVLNRQFVLEQLEEVRTYLEGVVAGDPQRRRGEALAPGAENLSSGDYKTTFELVAAALEKEARESSGQAGFEEPEEERRRGEDAPPIDDFAFFSRDPVMSNLQSALEEYFETQRPDLLGRAPPDGDGRRGQEAELPAVSDLGLEGYRPERDEDGRRVFEKFSETDPGWVSSALAMGIGLFRDKHEFVDRPATSKPMADRVRMVMVGDWGSGIPRAQRVADEMRKVIDDGKAQGLQQHVVHLGDVYYSGWKREVNKRFLAFWPVRHEEAGEISSWCLNANHDMYSGGHGYYKTLLRDDRFKRQEGSSMFSLENANWQILGLDSAWEDHRLKDPQPRWIRDQVSQAKQAGQKVILLSHHQLFSAFEKDGEHMLESLRGLLAGAAPVIRSWLWAHEHRCVLYKPHMHIPFARCIGHGGVPVYQWQRQSDPVPEPASYVYRGRFQEGPIEQWALFGFAVLDFDGPNIHVRYISEDGDEYQSEVIA